MLNTATFFDFSLLVNRKTNLLFFYEKETLDYGLLDCDFWTMVKSKRTLDYGLLDSTKKVRRLWTLDFWTLDFGLVQ